MRALVTGGAGFIGSNLVDALIDQNNEVVVLDDLSTGRIENLNGRALVIEGDVTEAKKLDQAMKGCDVVFHLAAHRAVLRSVEHPFETDRANTGGTLAVLMAAHTAGIQRVVCTSSSSVYGGAEILPTPESAPLYPRSPYAVSKLAGEHYARIYWEMHKLETVSLRPFNVFGPRQRADSQYATVIPLFIEALRSGSPPVIEGDGLQSRDFSFIDDTVAAFIAAGTASAELCAGKVYNVAGGRQYRILELLALLENILGVETRTKHVEPRPSDVRHTRADLSAARQDVKWQPFMDFDEGLRRTVAWFTDIGSTP